MRYRNEQTGDWVEFKPGLSRESMAKVLAASNTPTLLAAWIAKCEFAKATGAASAESDAPERPKVSPHDGAGILENLTFGQWDWLAGRLLEWARDDAIDPEA